MKMKASMKILIVLFAVFTFLLMYFGKDLVYAKEDLISGIDVSDKIKHKRIAVGTSSIAVLKDDGTVWGICYNDNAPLREGYKGDVLTKIEIPEKIVDISSDFIGLLALDEKGDVWQLDYEKEDFAAFSYAKKVKGIDNVVSVLVEKKAAVAIRKDGTVWIWGEGSKDFGYKDVYLHKPTKVKGLERIVKVCQDTFLTYEEEVYIYYGGKFMKIDNLSNVKDISRDFILKDDGTVGILLRSREDGFPLRQIEELNNIDSLTSRIYNLALDSEGGVWTIYSLDESILEIDKDVIMYEKAYINYDSTEFFRIKETKKIFSEVEEVDKGLDNIAFIMNEGNIMYVGNSFYPITEDDRNNIDFTIDNYFKNSEEFNLKGYRDLIDIEEAVKEYRKTFEEKEEIFLYKIQNVPKQFKYEDGTVFNIHE